MREFRILAVLLMLSLLLASAGPADDGRGMQETILSPMNLAASAYFR
jgi:hypothetical protein